MQLAKGTQETFEYIVEEAGDWAGVPLFDECYPGRGYLRDLRKKKMVWTEEDPDEGEWKSYWVYLTKKGIKHAEEVLGLDVSAIRDAGYELK